MFRLFPIFYDMAEGAPSGGGDGEQRESPSGGSSSGGSSGSSESSSSTGETTPTYAVNPTLTRKKDTDIVKGEGDKYLKSVPYKGNPTQSTLGSHSKTFGSPPTKSASRHIQLHAGPYFETGFSSTSVRVWVNKYVSAEDCSSQSIVTDNSFDYVTSIADVTPPNSGAPYHTGRPSMNMNFFGQNVTVGIEQYDTVQSSSSSVTLSLTSGSEQITYTQHPEPSGTNYIWTN